MAGGKETPRQKMIGMMYLVLTALLALNVSTAVLEKFAIIDDTLSKLVEEDLKTNAATNNNIQKSNFAGDRVEASKKQAEQIRALTVPMITYLEDLKKQMGTEDGKAIERAELVLNTNNSEEIMINHNTPQTGEDYEKKLNTYVDELNKIMGLNPPFKRLTRTAKDYDEFKEGHNKDKAFLEFAFEGVPTMAAIATVTEVQSEILKYEAAALDTLYKRAHAKTYEVDQLVPMVQSVSNTLVAGQSFEGDLFVAGSASGVSPTMFYGGQQIKVEEQEIGKSGIKMKVGKIKFPVRPAANYDASGKAKASFHVKINLPGAKEPYERDIEYFVVRPSPQFQSAAASSLYINCGNEQTVSIPGLSDLSGLNLSVPASEGSITKLSPGKFVIIPTRPVCNVSVLLDGLNIYTQQFKTKEVPIPVSKVVYGGGKIYTPENPLPAGTASVRVEPEILQKDFIENNKKDANYIVTSFTLVVKGSPQIIKGGSIPLAQYNLKSGDTFSITNVKVSRTTYTGQMVEVLGSAMSKDVKIK